MVACLRNSMFSRIVAIGVFIAISLFASGTESGQQALGWNPCYASGSDGVSLDLQISDCTAVLAIAFFNRGAAYYEKGDHNRAIADYNEAIRLDPKHARGFNNRCWSRAILGQLQAALADCGESLRLRPNDAESLDSRGFTYLKLGQIDNAIKDYDAVLKQIPKKASSLYGRGSAKLKKNDNQGGEADIAAARAIKADIAQEFARLGVPATVSAAAPVAQAAQSRPAVATGAATVKALFEKHDLIGTFAADCTSSVSEQNQYVVHRVNGDYVQRDSMTGPATRSDASLIDTAREAGPKELSLSWANEGGRTNVVMRVESRQWRFIESTRENGEKLISGGYATQGARRESPWLKKCG